MNCQFFAIVKLVITSLLDYEKNHTILKPQLLAGQYFIANISKVMLTIKR